jgi:hypothetical protein
MFGSPRKLSRIPQPGPRTTSCWCIIRQQTSLAAEPSVVLRLQSSRLTMQAEPSNTYFVGLYNFSFVRCNDARRFA